MSWLTRSALARLAPSPEAPPEALRVLLDEAEAMLRAGVHPTAAEWAQLEQHERAALTEAGRRLEVEQAIRISTAILGGSAVVSAEVDGGEALVRAQLAGGHAQMLEELRQARGAA